jgi:class 3 adenylate cyclase/tetratricopeptide (TPR) repeat protein
MERCPSCGQENPDGFRFCGACGAALVAVQPAREVRKTVTVLFCDVAGSTAMGERLDPESTRRVMARYFDAMRAAVERHGGTVEKFIGDAVMAVFGVPVVHEDDALRAVRAAEDMRSALTELNEELDRDWGIRIESRIGINTGEIVTGEGDSLATGDAVNIAARLEQLAAPGETLLGEPTHRLVRDAVVAEPVEPVSAKGKSQPLTAFRLTGLVEGAEFIARRLDSPLVGRENELAQLQRAFDHAVSERVAYQFTLLGSAGIGKSRLVRELHGRVDASLLAGRCLPYGEGITYWPLTEIAPLSTEIDFEANRDEIALETRRVFERLARERPLLVVFDDLQWSEPTFLDLIDHISDLARDAPMLLVCLARPELLDLRPGWGGGKLNATTMQLEALTEVEASELVDNLFASSLEVGTKTRIAAAAEGNPLFVEEMLAMLAENFDGDHLAIPPTIQALLAARLDRLGPDERTVVESAAVEGQEFRLDALVALVPSQLPLSDTLHSLVRKDLIRPAGDDTFRFKHLLLRDAAYEALPKEQRADLHERFAAWLEYANPELGEIIGYHLEQAYRFRAELGPVDGRTQEVARQAATLLAAAGQRASARADISATINLLERAVRLLPDQDTDAVALYPDLAAALAEGGDFERAEGLYRTAQELGDPPTALLARLRGVWLDVMLGAPQAVSVASIEATIAEAERLGEQAIVAEALWRLGVVNTWLGNSERGEQLLLSSLEHAESIGNRQLQSEVVFWIGLRLLWGPTPVDDALRECERLSQAVALEQLARTELLVVQGALLALRGEFAEGRQLAAEGRRGLLELGQKVQYAGISQPVAIIELLAGNAGAAESLLSEARAVLVAAGERGFLSTVSALLALALARQERYSEADKFAEESRRVGAEDDVITQIYWRVAKAKVVAGNGELDEARRLAAEAIKLAADYDSFDGPIAIVEVASLLEPAAARAGLERALASASAKGNVITAEQARGKLAALP